MNTGVTGVIVTYNPEIDALSRNLDALIKQVDEVLIYDNGSKNESEITKLAEKFTMVSFFENGGNLGLPIAYNKAMNESISRGRQTGFYLWIKTRSCLIIM